MIFIVLVKILCHIIKYKKKLMKNIETKKNGLKWQCLIVLNQVFSHLTEQSINMLKKFGIYKHVKLFIHHKIKMN